MRGLRSVTRFLALCAILTGGLLAVGIGPAAAGATLNVGFGKPYTTIQSAVDAAKSGDLIVVFPTLTYSESVVVNTSGLTIRGALNMPLPIVQPPADTSSGCKTAEGPGGSPDGFCIFSTGPGTINNIEIARMKIQNFDGTGVIAFGAVGLNVHDVLAVNNHEYGIARFDSSHTQIVNNTVTGNLLDPRGPGEAGIYNGDSPDASSLIRLNKVSGYRFGIFVRDSSHGTVTENTVTGNCFGMLIIDTGEPGDVSDWTFVHNNASGNTGACPADAEGGPASGVGIAIVGANHSRFTANTADNNFPTGDTDGTGGIVIISSLPFGGQDPAYLQVDNNSMHGNSLDLAWDLSGTPPSSIVLFRNSCTTSFPPGKCI